MVINGMHGMGDNIYQRSVVREINELVYLYTPWPQIYRDLENVRPVKLVSKLRTQAKNILQQSDNAWSSVSGVINKNISYSDELRRGKSMLKAMGECFGVNPVKFDLPEYEKPATNKKYAVIRPVTIRSEWKNISRSPLPEYISLAAKRLKELGYHTISVADLKKNEEWAIDPPECDEVYNKGELIFEKLMGIIQNASIVVGGVGWIVPAAIAYKTPLIIVAGGQGGHNSPEKIIDSPMCVDNVRWIFPDRYCNCTSMLHECDKTISNFDDIFNYSVKSLCLNN